jgi:hypothetical protein
VLALDAPYPLGDPAVERDAGRVVRTELSALSGDPAAAARIGALLGERGALVAGWRVKLEREGRTLSRLQTLYLPVELLDSLSSNRRVAEAGIARAREIDRELAELHADIIVANLTELVAASTRRHEARHGMEADRHPPLRYPPALEAYLGFELDGDGKPQRRVERARHELAAYLSEIASDPTTTHTSLWGLARSAFDPHALGSTEMYVAKVILAGLARQLSPTLAPGPFPDRAGLHPHARVLAGASAAQLRAAADALWRELYDESPIAIVDRPARPRP